MKDFQTKLVSRANCFHDHFYFFYLTHLSLIHFFFLFLNLGSKFIDVQYLFQIFANYMQFRDLLKYVSEVVIRTISADIRTEFRFVNANLPNFAV